MVRYCSRQIWTAHLDAVFGKRIRPARSSCRSCNHRWRHWCTWRGTLSSQRRNSRGKNQSLCCKRTQLSVIEIEMLTCWDCRELLVPTYATQISFHPRNRSEASRREVLGDHVPNDYQGTYRWMINFCSLEFESQHKSGGSHDSRGGILRRRLILFRIWSWVKEGYALICSSLNVCSKWNIFSS